jgi:hypothetical protein
VRLVLAAVVAALLVVVAGAVGGAFHDSATHHPARWDPRVRELVAFVEQARGHRFDHPVSVYFLSPAAYRKASQGGSDVSRPTAAQRRDSELDAAELRALGMLQGDPNLLDAGRQLADSGTLAFYDQRFDVVNVRGSTMSVALRVTLVHELTHALQDQQFDIARLLDTDDSERATAARAIAEGDATAVENAYVAQLPASERNAYQSQSRAQRDHAEAGLGDVPDVLTTLFGLPYALGSSFVDLVDADPHGTTLDRVDAVYDRMPAATSQLFDPRDYFDDVPVRRVTAPRWPTGGTQHDVDHLGAGFLFVMLSERIDPVTAMAAVDGWRGDRYRSVVVRDASEGAHDGRLCVAARIELATARDADELHAALSGWAAAMPDAASATVGHAGGSGGTAAVTLRTCDPGKDADVGLTGRSADALAYPVVRNELAAGQVGAGLDRDRAICVADAVVPQLTTGDLAAQELTPELQAKIQRLTRAAASHC